MRGRPRKKIHDGLIGEKGPGMQDQSNQKTRGLVLRCRDDFPPQRVISKGCRIPHLTSRLKCLGAVCKVSPLGKSAGKF